jgi:hypothetical protein
MGQRRTAAVSVIAAGLALAACGSGPALHAAPVVPPPSGTAPSPALTAQTLDQIDAQIDAVRTALTQATADLNDPKPDS